MKPIADLHCHPTMHPFAYKEANKKRKNNMWWDNPPKKCQRKSGFPEYFQTSIPALIRGNVRLVLASLYPLEQAWLNPKFLGTGVVSDIIAKQVVSHLPVRYINKVQSSTFNYFEYLNKEYQFLTEGSNKPHPYKGDKWKYIVATDASDVEEAKDDEHTIVYVPTIEGSHALVSGNAKQLIDDPVVHQSTLNNIAEVKKWAHPPMYITLAHHFYNGMVGQARSIPDGVASTVLHQQVGLNLPVNERGEKVIDCLLGINEFEGNGRRILIDTKHMSISARIWYYQKISEYNNEKSDADKIPIIASHMGYGNHKSMLDSIEIPDEDKNKYEKSKEFNPWSINLSDEEIKMIFKSGGIIGVNLDQRILSGDDVIDESKDFKRSDIRNNRANVVKFWTEQFAKNVLAIVQAVHSNEDIEEAEKASVWDCISLGTDFDGMINPVDAFIVSDELPKLREALADYLPTVDLFNQLRGSLGVEEILDKLMYDNVYDFVIKHYH
ncbi:membrane dipeptidase [Labilibacter marinus]|uniref:membrane dipeptidase n=1 Tax=Labilibacter marinus TaxID=1477105 RepID=UPI00094FBE5F|nr:membrane dipeptidase [Labilibacter marinus]